MFLDSDDIKRLAVTCVSGAQDLLFSCSHPTRAIVHLVNDLRGLDMCPVPGTPVYCKLGVAVEHTGIYLGNGKIAHLNGNGRIEAVSPQEFCGRLGGFNPTRTIYFAQSHGKALGYQSIADRAREYIGSFRNYNVVFDNCHQFTCGCLSGNFENPCNFFWMVNVEIATRFFSLEEAVKQLGFFSWQKWDYA